jgi:hypothetical protein
LGTFVITEPLRFHFKFAATSTATAAAACGGQGHLNTDTKPVNGQSLSVNLVYS